MHAQTVSYVAIINIICIINTTPGTCESATTKAAIFDLNAAAQTSDIPKDSKKAMTFNTMAVKNDDTLPYWDLNNNYLVRNGGGSLTEGQYYTHAYVLKWRASDTGWRTLFRHNTDHCAVVPNNAKDLGIYSNRNGKFRDSGYNVRRSCVLRNMFERSNDRHRAGLSRRLVMAVVQAVIAVLQD